MPFKEVCERTGISYDNLKQKSSREDWFVPVTAIAEAKAILAQAQANKADKADQFNGELSPSVTTGLEMAESIAEMGQKGQISVLRGMLPRLLKTFQEDSPLLSKDVEDWKTAGSMVNIFSKLSGLDKPQIAIQTNVWGDGWSGQGAVPVEAEDSDAS
jgi:hypothetical protein